MKFYAVLLFIVGTVSMIANVLKMFGMLQDGHPMPSGVDLMAVMVAMIAYRVAEFTDKVKR